MTKFFEVLITYCFWLAWLASGAYTLHYTPSILGRLDSISQKILILELAPILALFVFAFFLYLVKILKKKNISKIHFSLCSDLIWSQQLTVITKNTKLLNVKFISDGLSCHISPNLYSTKQKELYNLDRNVL